MTVPVRSVARTDGATVGLAVHTDVGFALGEGVDDALNADGEKLASSLTGGAVGEPVETSVETVGA